MQICRNQDLPSIQEGDERPLTSNRKAKYVKLSYVNLDCELLAGMPEQTEPFLECKRVLFYVSRR